MAFFNEFPHTRTYDSDLAWLIKRMKEILTRMDSLEERMQALEDLVTDFINSANIPQLIKDELLRMIAAGELAPVIEAVVYGSIYQYRSKRVACSEIFIQGNNTGEFSTGNTNSIGVTMINGQLYIGDSFIGGYNVSATAYAFRLKDTQGIAYKTYSTDATSKSFGLYLNKAKLNEVIAEWGVKIGTPETVGSYAQAFPLAFFRLSGSSPLLTADMKITDSDIRFTDFMSVAGGSTSLTIIPANGTGSVHLMTTLVPITAL